MKKKEQTIKCDVESCKHLDCEEGLCELDSIDVSCNCDHDKCTDKDETICKSFKKDKAKLKEAEEDDVEFDLDEEEED